MKDYEALEGLRGSVEIVFVLAYKESEKNRCRTRCTGSRTSIKSELHQHGSESCIDVLNVRADASKVREIFAVLKKNRCVHSVVYSVDRQRAASDSYLAGILPIVSVFA